MITSIAIDDEPLALSLLTDYASRTQGLELLKSYTNPFDAIKHLENSAVDLLFLDIQMPDMSGIAFFKLIKQNPMVIFTTAHSRYAVEGFNLNAIDYLLKPIEFNRFVLAVTKARDYKDFLTRDLKTTEKYIHVRSEYRLVKIQLAEVEYFESYDDFIKIHMADQKPILTLMTMKAIMEILPLDLFMRIHRSYIIPLNHVKSVRNNRVQFTNCEIPIGIRYKVPFMEWFTSIRI